MTVPLEPAEHAIVMTRRKPRTDNVSETFYGRPRVAAWVDRGQLFLVDEEDHRGAGHREREVVLAESGSPVVVLPRPRVGGATGC